MDLNLIFDLRKAANPPREPTDPWDNLADIAAAEYAESAAFDQDEDDDGWASL
jgi:hypothetical protein